MRDTLRLTNGLAAAPEGLLPRLARCFLVRDRDAAQNLAPQHPDCYFLLPDGVSYHGYAVSGGRKTGGGPLALKRELRELSATVEARQRETDALIGEIEELEHGAAALAEDLERVRLQQQAQEKDALRSGSRAAQAGGRVRADRIAAFGGAAGAGAAGARGPARAGAARGQPEARGREGASALRSGEGSGRSSRGVPSGCRRARTAVGEEHAALRADLAGREERLRSEKAAAARLEAQIRQLAARREELARDLERMGVDRARLLADNIELDQRAARAGR